MSQDLSIDLVRDKSDITEILLKEGEELSVQVTKKELHAPVQKGQTAGKLTYYIQGEKWIEEELICEEGAQKIDFEWCLKKVVGKAFN